MPNPHSDLPTPQVTLRDVARVAGVSRSTAQRALANDPRARETTRQRVRQIAEKLGYTPNPAFSTLGARQGRTRAKGLPIAFLHSDQEAPGIAAGTMYLEPCRQVAEKLGFHLYPLALSQFSTAREARRILTARGICAAIVSRVTSSDTDLLPIDIPIPLVICGRTIPLPFHTVRPAIVSALHLGWDQLRALGYRRIGLAIMRHEHPVEDDFSREAAARACLASIPDKERIPPLLTSLYDENAFARWVQTHQPDTVLSFRSGHWWLLRDLGYRMPEEIGFACLHIDGVASSSNIGNGQIAGLVQNRQTLAETVLNLLNDMLRRGEHGQPPYPLQVTIPSTWHMAGSLRESRGIPNRGKEAGVQVKVHEEREISSISVAMKSTQSSMEGIPN